MAALEYARSVLAQTAVSDPDSVLAQTAVSDPDRPVVAGVETDIAESSKNTKPLTLQEVERALFNKIVDEVRCSHTQPPYSAPW